MQHGRHDLPWRNTTDPWELIIAEVLLRKTTAQQALRVFKELAHISPAEIAQMADTDLEQILRPLGISKIRASQLKEIASKAITASMSDYQSDSFLRSLPGIGRYISNTVRSCAFGHPAPALDANMIRIIQRVFGWQSSRQRSREDRKLWEFAEKLVPIHQSKEFNWGVLDYAAAICTSRKPKCAGCVLNDICDYCRSNTSLSTFSISDEAING